MSSRSHRRDLGGAVALEGAASEQRLLAAGARGRGAGVAGLILGVHHGVVPDLAVERGRIVACTNRHSESAEVGGVQAAHRICFLHVAEWSVCGSCAAGGPHQ